MKATGVLLPQLILSVTNAQPGGNKTGGAEEDGVAATVRRGSAMGFHGRGSLRHTLHSESKT